jgi:carbamoyltransferase
MRKKIFDNIWIQPAAGDAGGALGAALSVWYLHNRGERKISLSGDSMKGTYLGPEFSDNEIESELNACGAIYKKLSNEILIDEVVNALVNEKAVGWMQGRMEFGPRALGGRSIIADPRSPKMQKQLNLKVKYRESFRPFAPSILIENVSEWFEHNTESPYMLLVADVKRDKRYSMTAKEENLFGIQKLNVPRSSVPAITHVDYSARIQTVHSDTNPRYYSLISKFKKKTGCPLLVNTSFNVRGEPIICTPKDAFRCFMGTELDVLAIGNFLLFKDQQNKNLKKDYKGSYELD